MRTARRAVLALGLTLAATGVAAAQGSGTAQGFGGLSVGQLAEPTPSLGGTLTIGLTEHLHVVGEAGRLGNVLSPLANAAYSIPGVRVSALYGEGGIRAFAGRQSAGVRPYVEGTVGVSRLNVSSSRLSPLGNAALTLGISFLDRTSPTLGVGGGVLAQAGPVVVDLGYRYKELLNTGTLGTVLGLGQGLRTHEVRAGFGFRF